MLNTIKPSLHQACLDLLDEKIKTLKSAIADAQKSASEDTKSSAGDKFETSREMMKLEIEKNSIQLSKALDMSRYLNQIDPKKKMNEVAYGSLVTTNEGTYFFSVSLGKVLMNDKIYFALSMTSPVGIALKGSKAGDEVSFMGRKIRLEAVE